MQLGDCQRSSHRTPWGVDKQHPILKPRYPLLISAAERAPGRTSDVKVLNRFYPVVVGKKRAHRSQPYT